MHRPVRGTAPTPRYAGFSGRSSRSTGAIDTNDHGRPAPDIGGTLQLQFVDDESGRRSYTRMIGYLPERSLPVTAPLRDGKVMRLREGRTMTVRILSGSSVYAFTTSTLASSVRPCPYLHLTDPKDLEMIVVDKAHRPRTNLVASVQHRGSDVDDARSVSVIIADIGITGALLKSEQSTRPGRRSDHGKCAYDR